MILRKFCALFFVFLFVYCVAQALGHVHRDGFELLLRTLEVVESDYLLPQLASLYDQHRRSGSTSSSSVSSTSRFSWNSQAISALQVASVQRPPSLASQVSSFLFGQSSDAGVDDAAFLSSSSSLTPSFANMTNLWTRVAQIYRQLAVQFQARDLALRETLRSHFLRWIERALFVQTCMCECAGADACGRTILVAKAPYLPNDSLVFVCWCCSGSFQYLSAPDHEFRWDLISLRLHLCAVVRFCFLCVGQRPRKELSLVLFDAFSFSV